MSFLHQLSLKPLRLVLLIAFLVSATAFALTSVHPDQGKVAVTEGKTSSAGLKAEALKYVQNSEKPATPISIKYFGLYYNYVPFEINGTINPEFPGLILDYQGNPATDQAVLQAVFKYPGLLKRFSYNVPAFDKLVNAKIKSIKKYCKIVSKQEKNLNDMYFSGTITNFIYEGIKVAMDGVDMVSDLTSGGISKLIKSLAKSAIRRLIISTFSQADMNVVMENIQKSYENIKIASSSCQSALLAWQSLSSRGGKITPEQVNNATLELNKTFKHEAESIKYLSKALKKINSYPAIITKIGSTTYKTALTNFTNLISKLETESKYWLEENTESIFKAEDWASEQLIRLNYCATDSDCATNYQCQSNKCEIIPEEQPVDQPEEEPIGEGEPPVSGCQSINIAENYDLYTYSPENNPCPGYQNTISENELKLRCVGSPAARWRNYWVKEINVSGLNLVNIKADLGLNDYTHFFTECGGVGVKYDDYSSILVLNSDPRPTFDQECNKYCSDADWPKCGIPTNDPRIIASCGVAKCANFKQCDFNINTSGLDKIYLLYHISDAWPADLEGVMGNLEVCSEESPKKYEL